MQNFWKHSIASGIAAKYLAEKSGYTNTEIFFIGGLLHDIGKILEYSAITDSAYILHSLSYLTKRQQHEIEKELLSFDHAAIGSAYIEANNLPAELKDMILFHHTPDAAEDPVKAAIIHLADILINCLKIGSSGQYYIPVINTTHSALLHSNLSAPGEIEKIITDYTEEMMEILLIE